MTAVVWRHVWVCFNQSKHYISRSQENLTSYDARPKENGKCECYKITFKWSEERIVILFYHSASTEKVFSCDGRIVLMLPGFSNKPDWSAILN